MTSRPQPSDPPPLASSDALRRAALARSAARGAVVARRRLAWRWTLFLLGRAALWLGLPLALAAGGWWWWQQQPPTRAARWPAAMPASVPASLAVQAAPPPAAKVAAAASDAPSLPASAALPASAPASAAASQPFAN